MNFPSEFTDENPDLECSPGSNNNNNKNKEDPNEEQQHTPAILRFKMVLLMAFALVAAAMVAIGIHIKRNQYSDLLRAFEIDEEKIKKGIGSNIGMTMSMLEVFSSVIVASTIHGNMSWPFISVPLFDFQSDKVLALTPMIALEVSPLISHQQRSGYDERLQSNYESVTSATPNNTSVQVRSISLLIL